MDMYMYITKSDAFTYIVCTLYECKSTNMKAIVHVQCTCMYTEMNVCVHLETYMYVHVHVCAYHWSVYIATQLEEMYTSIHVVSILCPSVQYCFPALLHTCT